MAKVVIIGAGGHGKVIAEAIMANGDQVVGFLDDNITGTVFNLPVLGDIKKSMELKQECSFVIGIGDNDTRRTVAEKYPLPWYTVIHPSASIASDVCIGEGTVIMRGVNINVSTSIGKHCIINTGAVVEHDNQIADYVHISPNATLCGTVNVTEGTHIGAGAVIKNNIIISEKCIVGAGAVVVNDINSPGIYIGIPARRKQ